MLERLSGWGRHPYVEAEQSFSEDLSSIARDASLTRGLGRSYGDASLPLSGSRVANSTRADRIVSFQEETGVLRVEAGFTLAEMVRVFLPRRWITPVSPGTQFVTVGGMVASDVHGKNHHVAGCFGEHVLALKLQVADGRILEISPTREPELFDATLGGMGLTGHILEVEFEMKRVASPWIYGESECVSNLDELVRKLREASQEWPYTMSWVDSMQTGGSLGRGIVMKGRWAEADEAPPDPPAAKKRLEFPCEFPGWVLAPWSMRLFNFAYYHKHIPRQRRGILHPLTFFYPLDIVGEWNRVYGREGFVQYQCVLPVDSDANLCRRFFETLSKARVGSFLTVVKDCGKEGRGMLSFPQPGISIALDLPMRGNDTQAAVDALNEVVLRGGGRIYLTKDSLTRPEHFAAMEGERLKEWNRVRRKWDPEGKLKSLQSVRLLGDEA